MKTPGFSIEQVEYRQKDKNNDESNLRYAIRRGDMASVINKTFRVKPRVGVVIR